MTVVLFFAVLALVVAAAVASVPARPTSDHRARQILDERLAAGEISPAEHESRLGVLSESRSRRRGGAVLAAIGVLALLVAAMAFAGGWTGGWGQDHDRMMGGHMGWTSGQGSGASADPVPGAVTVEVIATDLAFDPATIEVTVGEPVNLRLINDGEVFHDLSVPAADLVLEAEPGDEVTGALTIDEPGSYEFRCTVPGHAAAGMRGTVTVREAGLR